MVGGPLGDRNGQSDCVDWGDSTGRCRGLLGHPQARINLKEIEPAARAQWQVNPSNPLAGRPGDYYFWPRESQMVFLLRVNDSLPALPVPGSAPPPPRRPGR